jgi:integrase/recombinase XerD
MVIQGPLGPWAAGIAGQLEKLGYASSTVAKHMQLVGRLSRFVDDQGLASNDLHAEVVEEFFKDLHAHHGSSWPTAKAFVWLVDLREVEVMTAATSPAPISREEELLVRYRRYLLDERGLTAKTVVARDRTAHLFLAEHSGRELGDLDGGDVSRLVTTNAGA